MNVGVWFFFYHYFFMDWCYGNSCDNLWWKCEHAVLIVYNNLINICPSNGHSFDDTLLIMPHSLGPIIKYGKNSAYW